jgi:hypothetical protein
MTDTIVESGMPFICDNTFYIEKSAAYTDLGSGIKSVEFVRRKNETLFFVEAKTTFPNPSADEKNFSAESSDVADKFVHSLNLYASIALGLRSGDISATDNLSHKDTTVMFVLVIREHEANWCKSVKKKLAMLLKDRTYFRKIWRPKVDVINHASAIKYGLVKPMA